MDCSLATYANQERVYHKDRPGDTSVERLAQLADIAFVPEQASWTAWLVRAFQELRQKDRNSHIQVDIRMYMDSHDCTVPPPGMG